MLLSLDGSTEWALAKGTFLAADTSVDVGIKARHGFCTPLHTRGAGSRMHLCTRLGTEHTRHQTLMLTQEC